VIAAPAGPLAQPHLAATTLVHPTLAQGIAMATEGTQARQCSTEHRPTHHLATSTVTTVTTQNFGKIEINGVNQNTNFLSQQKLLF
jgi:hypothetical protein